MAAQMYGGRIRAKSWLNVGSKVWNTMTEEAPNSIFLEVAQSTAKNVENQRK